jgi:hypothetical protein
MNQQETKPWVLVSNVQEDTKTVDLQMIAPQISALVDEWQSEGKIMWSGAFDNERSSMAVFEATEDEAKEFFKKYESICSGVLNYYLHQWDAMPILSVLSN